MSLRLWLALILWLSFGFVLRAQQPTLELDVVLSESIFVRANPSEDGLVIGSLFAGDVVYPQNISPDGEWLLISYRRTFGWVQRDLIRLVTNIDNLPLLLPNTTPTPNRPPTATPFFPTATPDANYVAPSDARSLLVRAGPGRTYLYLGALRAGDFVEPVARNQNTSWIMIRYENSVAQFQGFGWILKDAVTWRDESELEQLPVVDEIDLTPTQTFTPTAEPSVTPTAEPSVTPTATTLAAIAANATDVPPSPTSILPSITPAPLLPLIDEPVMPINLLSQILLIGVVTLLIAVYLVLYARARRHHRRYHQGFIIDCCPVCGGDLYVESRLTRIIGIPQSRHIVRCHQCRSILRQTTSNTWRYAVDPNANLSMYQRFNGKTVTNDELIRLAHDNTSHSDEKP